MMRSSLLIRRVGGALAALALTAGLLPVLAQPAHAAAQVTISGTAAADGPSTVQVSGSGFQSVQGGFGGIYVLFGWVDDPSGGSWKPSNGGATGTNYRYVYDDETNPTGYQLFVTFPGSSTADAANGGEVAADGTWSGNLIIPGAVFQTFDRQLNETTVDCTEVTCGVITIGAHGVKNANNETFTPIDFAGAGVAATGANDAASSAGVSDASAAAPVASAAQAPAADGAQAPDSGVDAVGSATGTAASGAGLAWFQALSPALFLFALALVILAAGVGAYLAMKALLLGVNPEALEKVRGQRERKAIRQRERQRRKTVALERQHELRAARASDRDSAKVARAHMRSDGGSTQNSDQSLAAWLSFFQRQQTAQPSGESARKPLDTELLDGEPTTVLAAAGSAGTANAAAGERE